MRRTILISTLSLATGLAVGGFVACTAEDEIDDEIESRLVDEEDADEIDDLADAESLNRPMAIVARVGEIQLHHAERGWVTVHDGRVLMDLMNPKQMRSILKTARMYDGKYDQIALDVRDLMLETRRGWYEVEMPGEHDVLRIHVSFCVTGGQADVPLAWDVPSYLEHSEQHGYRLQKSITVKSSGMCRGGPVRG